MGESSYEDAPRKKCLRSPSCTHCGNESRLADGAEIYPPRRDLHHLSFWKCDPCDAWVGCHRGTFKTMGYPANAELRKMRMRFHASFDPIWRDSDLSRKSAYRLLAKEMGIEFSQCHGAMFDAAQAELALTCVEAIKACLPRSA